ncbi:MAG TPA: orotidine-5'-phosphate decarboxylase [Kineosporiaceae bacterium]|nr:orotidine-5'-phosphate decarboxylase [Kineosporiaceae bacterium]
MRRPFGERLDAAVAARGPLCVGIDPHPGLLAEWGLADDVQGLEVFALAVVDALADRAAVLKPQVAFFERHGSRGVAVLEHVLAEAGDAGALTIADAKRGDIGSTMAAYADAFLGEGSPLAADAVTVSPYLGFGALVPVLQRARATGRGAFVLALTSNPEGAQVQHARTEGGESVAQVLLDAVRTENLADMRADGAGPDARSGSFGVVVGATVGDVGSVAPRLDVAGPVLAPGIGAQGASAADLRAVFGPALRHVLPSVSREILRAGAGAPDAEARRRVLRTAFDAALTGVRAAIGGGSGDP